MTDLLADLDATIAALEKIRDSAAETDPELISQISDLYDQQQRLLENEIATATEEYKNAAAAMNKAAKKARAEADNLSDAVTLVNNIANALEAVESLLG